LKPTEALSLHPEILTFLKQLKFLKKVIFLKIFFPSKKQIKILICEMQIAWKTLLKKSYKPEVLV
jgi:hypothetical protein